MLRLHDPRSGQLAPVARTGRGELRVLIHAPQIGGRPHLGDLRTYLLPDLIRRCAQRRGLPVTTAETLTADEPAVAALGGDRAALNIYPSDRTFPSSQPATRLIEFAAAGQAGDGGPAFDVVTGDDGSHAGEGLAAHRAARTGSVTFEGRDVAGLADASADGSEDGVAWLGDVAGLGLDPLALRLAFLKHRYRDQADLTWDELVAADRTLHRWREQVAAWATEPSAPLVRSYADAVSGAFDDDLDTPAALRHLQALEADSAVPAGAKFETFAHLDQLFGLDLSRDIGRY